MPWSFGFVTAALLAVIIYYLIPSDELFLQSNFSTLSSNLTIVITGANSGVGYATVEHLAKAGTAKIIILACRNEMKCTNAKERAEAQLPTNSTTQLVTAKLDLSSRSSIEEFAKKELPELLIQSQTQCVDTNDKMTIEPTIDVLVNNAGIFASNLNHTFIDGLEEHMFVNHLGHVLMMHFIWPILTKSQARIVSISSISALLPLRATAGWTPSDKLWSEFHPSVDGMLRYARSKRANLFFAEELQRRYGSKPDDDSSPNSGTSSSLSSISSVASHPGYTRTEIWSNGAKIFPKYAGKLIQWNSVGSMSSPDGAKTQVWAALDRHQVPGGTYVGPRWWLFGNPIGLGFIEQQQSSNFPQHYWPSFEKRDELWNKTMEALGISIFGSS